MTSDRIDSAYADRLRELTREIIAKLGGQTRTANLLGAGQSTVSDWRAIPAKHVPRLVELLGCRPSDIRPDIFTETGDLRPAPLPEGHADRARIGRRLRYLRRAKSISVEDFAAALKVSPGAVSQWETGANGIRQSRIAEIERILGDSLDGDVPMPVTLGPVGSRSIDDEIEDRIRQADDEIGRLEKTLGNLKRERDALRRGLETIRAGRGEGA
jgi:transcriptional regulator with XRE-family HTH domain